MERLGRSGMRFEYDHLQKELPYKGNGGQVKGRKREARDVLDVVLERARK
jgi:hypothetical protein